MQAAFVRIMSDVARMFPVAPLIPVAVVIAAEASPLIALNVAVDLVRRR